MILRRAAIPLLCLLFQLLAGLTAGASGITVTVRHVLDGDTVVLENGETVRYMGVNAPEVPHRDSAGEPFGEEAKKRNRELVQGKMVILDTGERPRQDRFGRLLADLVMGDGRSVSAILVQEGLAYVCAYGDSGTRASSDLLEIQNKAIDERRGLWSVPPKKSEPYYIANRKSMRFHRPGCPFGKKTAKIHRVTFPARDDAFRAGFCPCKKCQP